MKKAVNRTVCIILVVLLTAGIWYQTNLAAKRTAFSKRVQEAIAQGVDPMDLENEELIANFEGKSSEIQQLIDSAGMSDDKDFVSNATDLFTRLYDLLKDVIVAGDDQDVLTIENNFIDIFNGLFALDTQLNEINPELTGELTNRGFVCSAISIVWDFMTYYDYNRVAKQTMKDGITRLEDIPYIDDGTNEHMLDVYYPQSTDSALPVIIDIHGGGLMMGDKDTNRIYCSYLADYGFTVISINYRLSPDVLYPSQIQDIMAAYSWINSNADKYFCDLSRVYVTGDSAGGQLAYYSALVESSTELQNLYNVTPSGLSIDSLGLVSGMYDMKNGINSALMSCFLGFDYRNSIYYPYLQPDEVLGLGTLPPSYVVTSAKDFVRPAAFVLEDALKQYGVEYQLHDWPVSLNRSSGHITSVAYPELEESRITIDEMIAFFNSHTTV